MYLSIIPSMTTAQPPTSPSFLHLMLDQSPCSTAFQGSYGSMGGVKARNSLQPP